MCNTKDLHVKLPDQAEKDLEYLSRFFGSNRAAVIFALRSGAYDLESFSQDMMGLDPEIAKRLGLGV